jgi:hypothetical protein
MGSLRDDSESVERASGEFGDSEDTALEEMEQAVDVLIAAVGNEEEQP